MTTVAADSYKTMSSNIVFPAVPQQFRGKWNKKTYSVLRELGRGANGVVYLVSRNGSREAVKVGIDPIDLLMEVNMLKSAQKHKENVVGPLLCDVDDLEAGGRTYTFYSMEYLEGARLDQHIESAGSDWIPIVLIQLLSRLEALHAQGWVFGDLKPENIMVTKKEKKLRLIDFGGVTRIGNAVRQFTDDYDRASWQAGDRRADVRYDLFAVAMIMLRLQLGKEEWKRIKQVSRHVNSLCDIIKASERLFKYRVFLIRALTGQYPSASMMKAELMALLRQRQSEKQPPGKQGKNSAGKWLGGAFVASLLLLAYSLYIAWM